MPSLADLPSRPPLKGTAALAPHWHLGADQEAGRRAQVGLIFGCPRGGAQEVSGSCDRSSPYLICQRAKHSSESDKGVPYDSENTWLLPPRASCFGVDAELSSNVSLDRSGYEMIDGILESLPSVHSGP
jgi:hypothetical protein